MPGLGGDPDLRCPSVVGRDVVAGDGDIDGVEVLPPHPDQALDLVGPVPEPVFETVGQRTVAEAAVARAGPETTALGLEHDDPEAGLVLEGLNRGPQSGKTGADHREVGGHLAVE